MRSWTGSMLQGPEFVGEVSAAKEVEEGVVPVGGGDDVVRGVDLAAYQADAGRAIGVTRWRDESPDPHCGRGHSWARYIDYFQSIVGLRLWTTQSRR